MHTEELIAFNQKISNLSQMISCISIQLSAAMKLGVSALPKLQQEFEDIKQMAVTLGIDEAGGKYPAHAKSEKKPNMGEYLNAMRALGRLHISGGKTPDEQPAEA